MKDWNSRLMVLKPIAVTQMKAAMMLNVVRQFREKKTFRIWVTIVPSVIGTQGTVIKNLTQN